MADFTIDETVDITDVVCPMTFVKAKVAMEELEIGQVLSVHIDVYKRQYLNMAPGQTLKWVESGKNPSEQNVEIEGTEPYIEMCIRDRLPSMHYEYMERKTVKVSSAFHVRFDNCLLYTSRCV